MCALEYYGKYFAPANIDHITQDGFRDFLVFKNNRHWAHIQRHPEIYAHINATFNTTGRNRSAVSDFRLRRFQLTAPPSMTQEFHVATIFALKLLFGEAPVSSWLTNDLGLLSGQASKYLRHPDVLSSESMTTISGLSLCKSEIVAEIQVRLQLTEFESERMLRNFRALPESHPCRFELLRRLEVAAAVSSELADLLGLIEGRVDRTDRTDHTTESSGNRPPARRGRPRE